MTNPSWAIAIIEPNRDMLANQALQRHGFRSVCLTYRRRLTGHNRPGWRRTSDFVTVPLFPGYIFLDLDDSWPMPAKIRGYYGLLDAGKARLDDSLVAEWKRRTDAGEFDDRTPTLASAIKNHFLPCTDPEQRRILLEARFAQMIATPYAQAS